MSKSIRLKNDTYLDSTGIVHNKMLLSEILLGNWVANLDELNTSGIYWFNPDTQGTHPNETNRYGQLISLVNNNRCGEGFSMKTQIAVTTWANGMYIRTNTNETNWTAWRVF